MKIKYALLVRIFQYKKFKPLNCTVEVPSPPDFVVTIISPLPLQGPDLATILFRLFHSADSKHSQPQIFKPVCTSKIFLIYNFLLLT